MEPALEQEKSGMYKMRDVKLWEFNAKDVFRVLLSWG